MQDFTSMTNAQLKAQIDAAYAEVQAIADMLMTMPTYTSDYAAKKAEYRAKHALFNAAADEFTSRGTPVAPIDKHAEYAAACDRYTKAANTLDVTRTFTEALTTMAAAEYETASHELAKYEIRPGVPKPECDPLQADGK